MHRLKARWKDLLARRVVFPFCRRFLPVIVLSPRLQRAGLALVGKRVPPGVPVAPLALVFRHADVCEVLGDHERFPVDLYDERMRVCSNPFLLGMGFTPEYQKHIAILRSVMLPADAEWIREIAEKHAEKGIAAAEASGRIDVVQDLVGPVVAGFLNDYFGVPDLPGARPGTTSPLLQRFLDTASYIFNLEVVTGPAKAQQAERAGKEIAAHFAALIAERRRATTPNVTSVSRAATDAAAAPGAKTKVIDRLVANREVPDELARTILGGTVSGSIAVTFSQCLWVIDRLLDLPPEKRAEVQHVALSGDDKLLDRYVREASRWKPFPPGLLRRCESDQALPRNAPGGRRLAPGTVVAALTWSAAFDRRAVPNAFEFHIGRADREYLLFGTGQHHCIGAQAERPFAQTLMRQMVKALFVLPGLRRARGAAGYIEEDASGGRWPAHFMLEFDDRAASSVAPRQAA